VNVSSSHLPPGLTIADTAVQDAGFVAVALYFAQLGGRKVDAAMFGLRPTRVGRAVWLVVVLIVGFVVFSVIWTSVFHAEQGEAASNSSARMKRRRCWCSAPR